MERSKIPLSKVTCRILLSPTGGKMTSKNRNKQELSWYTGGIYLCSHFLNHGRIADKIEEECKRRNIPFKSILAKERAVTDGVVSEHSGLYDYDVRKVAIPQSPETTALERKELADWAITTINLKPGRVPGSYVDPVCYTKAVWIQPWCDVDPKEVDDKSGIEMHWVKYLYD